MKLFKNTLMALGLAACLSFPAFAADKVVMTDGRVFVGDIIQETEHVVRIKVTHGRLVTEEVLFVGDIAEIQKDISTGDEVKNTGGSDGDNAAATQKNDPADAARPGVLVLPLVGGVGETFRHNEIEMVAKEADRIKDETGIAPIIVLEIESGGGLVMEAEKIHDTLVEVKKRHRVVAWIKEAISAAAATAYHCDEIYFYTDGALGAMTAYRGTVALKGEELEQWIETMSRWAEAGGRPGIVARAMITNRFELSYDIDPETGEIIWHDDLSGEYVLSTSDRNLVLNSSQALHSGFADGIADTEAELAELLDLPEWHEMSDYGRKAHEDWVKTFDLAMVDIPRIYGRLQQVQQSGAADDEEKLIRAINLLQQLIRWWDRAPFVCEVLVGVPPKDQLERIIDEYRYILKQIRDARRQQGGGGRGGGYGGGGRGY